MGHSQSSLAKEESRRSNRLSKPLTKRPNTVQLPLESDHSSSASGLIGWQNPWVGQNISTNVEKRGSYPKKAEIPPTLFETDSPEESPTEERSFDHDPALEKRRSARSSIVTTGSRRTSYQSETCSPHSPISEYIPRRASSTRTALQRHNSAVYENQATSSNTHFLVGNQRFSLTRRRSLLTRPGVATRRTTSTIRRVPSPIGEPEFQNGDQTESAVLQWPLPWSQYPSSPARPTSPNDTRYTQLGALKLGSLRVVNGSASPCPSDRVSLSGAQAPATIPGLGLENMEVTESGQASALEIIALPSLETSDDVPGSPFSFEKSPIIAAPSRVKSLFSAELEDEGIALSDDTRVQLQKSALDVDLARSTSRSLNKSDSGYSSATSVHSIARSRTQSSAGSQSSVSCGADSAKNLWISNGPVSDAKLQRHLSLQSKAENYSRVRLGTTRWYESNGPSLAPSRSRRSTLGAPLFTEHGSRESTVKPPSRGVGPHDQQGFTRGPLYGDRLSIGSFDVAASVSSSATRDSHGSQQTVTSTKDRLRKSTSENHLRDDYGNQRPRSRSRIGRVWTMKPGVEAPPLPTILSPGYLQDDLDHELNLELIHSEPVRGRPRTRSNDHRRRKLTKARPPADVYI